MTKLLLLIAIMTMLSACNQATTASDDRASRLYASAMAELQSGNVKSAIKRFEGVVRAEPGNGDAHFQLAALLEESEKDYLGAISHYRQYLVLRPKSDKASVALDRMRGCETRYASSVIDKANLGNRASEELKALRAEHAACGEKIAQYSAELDKAKRTITALENEIKVKMRMLESAKNIVDDNSVKSSKKIVRPTDAQLLDDELPGGGRALSTSEIKDLRAMLEEDERTAAKDRPVADVEKSKDKANSGVFPGVGKKENKESSPQRVVPKTYTVEEGDTLMRISTKFYGTSRRWRDIREANKATISTDCRVKAGQVINLP